MTQHMMIEVLKAHLAKEGLVLCRPNDTQFPLDGFKENEALASIIGVIEDSQAVAEWIDPDAVTTPVEAKVLDNLTRAAAS